MSTLVSYDLNGKKLSFANWISNLSPQETPFSSMTKKESIQQTLFQWQSDSLSPVTLNAVKEGAKAVAGSQSSTTVRHNITQILRKVVRVSETANATANYGRGKELQYQMEKAGKELKRDIEWGLLNNQSLRDEGNAKGRLTAGFSALVAPVGSADVDTGAVVHKQVTDLTESTLFDLTYNLYLAGACTNIIMYHPKHASFFSGLQEKAGGRERMFENTPKFSVHVTTVVDPLGQEYKLVPNRWMPQNKVYIFDPKCWTQMILRAPQRVKLAKDGSYEKWMIEVELGLRHKHPFASGVLEIKTDKNIDPVTTEVYYDNKNEGSRPQLEAKRGSVGTLIPLINKEAEVLELQRSIEVGAVLHLSLKGYTKSSGGANVTIPLGNVQILKDGVVIWKSDEVYLTDTSSVTDWTGDSNKKLINPFVTKADAGYYSLRIVDGEKVLETPAIGISVSDPTPAPDGETPNVQRPLSLAAEESVLVAKKTRKPRAKKLS